MVWALVPARLGPEAKRRLAPVLPPEQRGLLARAMLRDVLAALRDARTLAGIAVVGRGRLLFDVAAEAGALAIAEGSATTLNAAVAEGITACVARGAAALVVAMGDLPLLTGTEVDRLVAALPRPGIAIAPSLDGTGTNLFAASPPAAIETAFGPNSRARHRALAAGSGLRLVECELAGAALDVDTPRDLAHLVATAAAGGETRAALGALRATSSVPSASRSRSDLPIPPWSR
jgi:2-phospho-L-lactate guanylyltransferase